MLKNAYIAVSLLAPTAASAEPSVDCYASFPPHRVIGNLYFKSTTLRWDEGTYRLVFNNDKGHAELPIRLE